MNDELGSAVIASLNGMIGSRPKKLLRAVEFHLGQSGEDDELDALDEQVDAAGVVARLTADDLNDPVRVAFLPRLGRWDATDPSEPWTDGTTPHTPERRARVVSLLGFDAAAVARITSAFPLQNGMTVIADEEDWDPWYTDEVARDSAFYWTAYRDYLRDEKGLPPDGIESLDASTHEVVRRLADPSRHAPYQAKGLVVGHVQSGKTAHFTGTVAKAIDAGYRLVIVLTGTIELLRGQTQRRLDMELVGRENLLGGRDPGDPEQARDIDYVKSNDRDWKDGKFLSLGAVPEEIGRPAIRRLTSADTDYRALRGLLSYLDFKSTDTITDPRRPIYDPVNLPRVNARLAVVKKNASVLAKVVQDLRGIRTRLGEIPTLIIDDEADEASVNTRRPTAGETTERTAINRHIAELLREMPRAQYVAYTATPFANVFVDPDDEEDIFPKDFVVSLDPPPAYMGGRQFHDLDRDPSEPAGADPVTSNEAAFVRGLYAPPEDDDARALEIRGALDAYVLSGAIKLYRAEAVGKPGRFRHHTMLVHESRTQADHADLAETVRQVWREAGYTSPAGLRRLHDLWRDDFTRVSAARAGTEPFPTAFNDLRAHIGEAVRLMSRGRSPVVVVNGDADLARVQDQLDFQADDVWKVLVGGAKLSRGFTVEGLTTTYFTRRATSASAMMQMGRWFGYRPGYQDLVRLHIGRAVPGARGGTEDLYRAFEGIVRDEEDFRAQLRRYQGRDEDGRPLVKPIDVPPLVFQSVPWLRPTSANKMFNARLTSQGIGGRADDFLRQAPRDAAVNREHFAAMLPLFDAATRSGEFFSVSEQRVGDVWQGGLPPHGTYRARYGIVDAGLVRGAVARFRWTANYDFEPYLRFVDQIAAEGGLTEWVVVVPEPSGARGKGRMVRRTVAVPEGRVVPDVPVAKRTRRPDRPAFSGFDPKSRDLLEIVTGGYVHHREWDELADPLLDTERFAHVRAELAGPTRGAILLNFAADAAPLNDKDEYDPERLPDPVDAGDVATLFSWALPYLAAPRGRVAFSVRDRRAGATVERDS